MRPGTPGFVGARLQAAREARGIVTASGLAEMIGVSRAAVSQYERGEQTPSPAVMQTICEVLNLPLHHFVKPQLSSDGVHFFRSLASASKVARSRARRKYEWLLDIISFLREYIEFTKVNFPTFAECPGDPMQITDALIEQIATRLRRHWGLNDGPISNVVWLLENMGGIVVRLNLDSDKLDAFSRWNADDATPYIILGTHKGTTPRSRFNAAHELAHLILHRNVSAREFSKPAVFKEMERQAHRFAGAFLLPSETFLNDLYTASLDVMKALKPRWKVSIALMLKRAEDLGAITERHAKPLWMNLARRGWKRSEPLDESFPSEEPRFLHRCFTMLLDAGLVSRDELPTRLGLTGTDIEELANLPAGFLAPISVECERSPVTPKIIKFPRTK